MARIRTVKPDLLRHEQLQDLECENPGQYIMLTYIGLFQASDKNGCFEWRPRTLKLDILPFIEFDLSKTLDILRRNNFIVHYEIDGKQYGHIPTFREHQRISGKELQIETKIPLPAKGSFCEALGKHLGSTCEAPEKHPGAQEGKGREKERKGKDITARSDSESESSEQQEAAEEPLHRKSAKKVQNAGVDPEQPAVMTLPLADRSDHHLTAADLAELSSLYPGVDPEQELLKAKGWLIANPTRRKTHRGIARFIHGWLSRAQDRGNGKYAKDPPPAKPEADEFEDPDEPMHGHPDLIEQERARRRAKYNNDPALIETARAEWREKHGYE